MAESERQRTRDDVASVPIPDLAPAVVESARRWAEFIGAVTDHPGGAESLRLRPADAGWSAIEYACHTRDVVAMLTRNIELVLLSPAPELPVWDGDLVASENHYLEQHPAAVADDLRAASDELAALVQTLDADALDRRGRRGDARPTAADLVRDALRELRHHLADARRVVPAPASS